MNQIVFLYFIYKLLYNNNAWFPKKRQNKSEYSQTFAYLFY